MDEKAEGPRSSASTLKRYLRAFWFFSNNVGDCLTPWLIARMTGKWPIFTSADHPEPKLIVAGSILNWTRSNATVWGAGLAAPNDEIHSEGNIVMVRGPLSRAAAMHYGHNPSEVCGDPGLVVGKYFTPSGNKTSKIGIIPHYDDQIDALEAFADIDGVRLINTLDTVDEVLEGISECEMIAASSLHGLILADALGVKSVWCTFSRGMLHPFKFHDHLLSVNVEPYDPISMDDPGEALKAIEEFDAREPEIDVDAMLELCPFLEGEK